MVEQLTNYAALSGAMAGFGYGFRASCQGLATLIRAWRGEPEPVRSRTTLPRLRSVRRGREHGEG